MHLFPIKGKHNHCLFSVCFFEFIYLCHLFMEGLRIKPRALDTLGKYITIELYSQTNICLSFKIWPHCLVQDVIALTVTYLFYWISQVYVECFDIIHGKPFFFLFLKDNEVRLNTLKYSYTIFNVFI